MLRPEGTGEIPVQTARVAKAAFPKGSTIIKLRDAFGTLYQDQDFAPFFSNLGQLALAPWRLALVHVSKGTNRTAVEEKGTLPMGTTLVRPNQIVGTKEKP